MAQTVTYIYLSSHCLLGETVSPSQQTITNKTGAHAGITRQRCSMPMAPCSFASSLCVSFEVVLIWELEVGFCTFKTARSGESVRLSSLAERGVLLFFHCSCLFFHHVKINLLVLSGPCLHLASSYFLTFQLSHFYL